MGLSSEERRKIYEEEKARIDAESKIGRETGAIPSESSVDLPPRLAGLLCYLGVWITGLVFFFIEQKNKWIRFHAAQSIVVFGTLGIAGMVLGWIPFIGTFFSAVVGIISVIFWILLMVKAYNGERYKVPWAGDVAEMLLGTTNIPNYAPPAPPAASSSGPAGTPAPPPSPPEPAPPVTPAPAAAAPSASAAVDKETQRRIDAFFNHPRREGKITGSAFAIAWCIILLVFFNFFNKYIAYYTSTPGNGISNWTRDSFFTADIKLWLPILNTALVVAIVCHLVMILVDKNLLRQALHLIMDGFGLATVITLLAVYPFDFNVIPNEAAASGTNLGVTVVLICISVGLGIGVLVRLIRLLVGIGRAVIKTD